MLRGFFDSAGRPRLAITLTSRRSARQLDALIDTGFTGALTVPVELAVELGPELAGRANVELADGTLRRELLFIATVTLDQSPQRVHVGLTSSDDALIGTGLLAGRRLIMDFGKSTITVR